MDGGRYSESLHEMGEEMVLNCESHARNSESCQPCSNCETAYVTLRDEKWNLTKRDFFPLCFPIVNVN